ncbi:hypothetical protein B6D52_00705 [Candidatus Parcubacteria bacterium 4484_255]|nr:MAG: hypothetical protein B6D52_00705 [Candidatus Parcubacteria bacterium 4484_255]
MLNYINELIKKNTYWWFSARQKIIMALVSKAIAVQKNLNILDAGCGAGNFIVPMRKYGQVWAVDNSPHAIKFCQTKKIRVYKSSLKTMPFADNFFDITLVLDVLEHINDDSIAIKELKRVTKKNGLIFITVPAYQFLWSYHDVSHNHKRRYTIKTLKNKLRKNNLQVLKATYFNTFLFLPIVLIRFIKKLSHSEKPDINRINPLLNTFLEFIFSCEKQLIKHINFPFGISLIIIAKK